MLASTQTLSECERHQTREGVAGGVHDRAQDPNRNDKLCVVDELAHSRDPQHLQGSVPNQDRSLL